MPNKMTEDWAVAEPAMDKAASAAAPSSGIFICNFLIWLLKCSIEIPASAETAQG